MSYYYICKKENDISNFFKQRKINIIVLNNYNRQDRTILENTYNNINKGSIVFYHSDCLPYKINTNLVNILIIDKPFVNAIKLNFQFYLPISSSLFFKYISLYGFKLLLPINILNSVNWNKYFITSDLAKYEHLLKGKKDTIQNSSIFIYNHPSELNKIQYVTDKHYLRIHENKVNLSLFQINNYINLSTKTINNTNILIPSKKTYQAIFFDDYLDSEIKLEDNTWYFISRKGTNISQNEMVVELYKNLGFEYVTFLIQGILDNELGLLYYSKKKETKRFLELFEQIDFHDPRTIGINDNPINEMEFIKLYYHYGRFNFFHLYEHLIELEYSYYEILFKYLFNIHSYSNQTYNQNKFKRIYAFWCGKNRLNLEYQQLQKFIQTNYNFFTQKKILILSKPINRYGGVQKTSFQIYNEMILNGYDVKIGNYLNQTLISNIDKNDIIALSTLDNVLKHITSETYDYIIVNKLDEIIDMLDKINYKTIFITHNSMDPVNRKLINHSKYLYKVFTVNHEHLHLLYENNIECKVNKYINYNDIVVKKVENRKEYLYNILFIGRISREKNIESLITAFTLFLAKNSKVTLTIIGDGNYEPSSSLTPNIRFLGKLNQESIIYHLSNSDYLIIPSLTEGCPFVILEAMNIGIPILSSKIVGCKELVRDEITGFTFELKDYYKYKNNIDNWDILNHNDFYLDMNIQNMVQMLHKAYSISIELWNKMSNNCYELIQNNYNNKLSKNINSKHILQSNNILIITNKIPQIKGFDIYIDFKTEETHVNYNNYDFIIKLSKLHNYLENNPTIFENIQKISSFVNKINKISFEMISKHIYKIIDKENNYFTITTPINPEKNTNVIDIESMYNILF